MVRELIGLCGVAVERCSHNSLLGVATFTAAALFTAVSLGFVTLAAYDDFRASEGPVAAALIVAASYGLLAIAILAIGVARRRADRLRRAATAAAAPRNVDALLQSVAASGAPLDQLALIAGMRLGRKMSTMQLLALTVAAGFIAGRNPTLRAE